MENTYKNEAQQYAESIRDDIKNLYENGVDGDGEESSLYDYIADALDIEYTIDSNFNYIGCRIYVTLGGPSCWIDTREGYVRATWGTDRGEAWLPSEICDEIDGICGEYYNASRC